MQIGNREIGSAHAFGPNIGWDKSLSGERCQMW